MAKQTKVSCETCNKYSGGGYCCLKANQVDTTWRECSTYTPTAKSIKLSPAQDTLIKALVERWEAVGYLYQCGNEARTWEALQKRGLIAYDSKIEEQSERHYITVLGYEYVNLATQAETA
ncbi:hypothetical protein [Tumebacillus permanentifrigoris]|uniref:Uncharacterized protein n=1 Tax=Tumebacillus permanentifrigoris TaxID=378543 RepID=A0A316D433_9BACL|nr:hypothetical protein [Tumebacillus permanentifrigoris]PWK03956.1 hypothetical protein C7459_13812 [Tumebacillus permanentifrigoris]